MQPLEDALSGQSLGAAQRRIFSYLKTPSHRLYFSNARQNTENEKNVEAVVYQNHSFMNLSPAELSLYGVSVERSCTLPGRKISLLITALKNNHLLLNVYSVSLAL